MSRRPGESRGRAAGRLSQDGFKTGLLGRGGNGFGHPVAEDESANSPADRDEAPATNQDGRGHRADWKDGEGEDENKKRGEQRE